MTNYKTATLLLAALVTAATVLTSCEDDDNGGNMMPVDKPDIEFVGLTANNQLATFNANAAGSAMETLTLTGLAGGERVVGIDFRPATGQLYGVTNMSRLYILNYASGVATPLGTEAFSPAVTGEILGFDFNPTVDRIRLVTSGGQNLRLHPETGAVAATDGNINPASATIAAVAYTNSVAGTMSTVLFDIDLSEGILYKQDPPNDGTLVAVGALDINAGATDAAFDISFDNEVALASVSNGESSTLYQIDLASGKSTDLGPLSTSIIGLAIPTAPVAYAVDGGNNLQIFNFEAAGTPVMKAITGLASGEMILGIDMRPATGQLYALGSTSRIYTINMATGAAAAIGDNTLTTTLEGTSFGFDFNPTVDRIRVVSNTGQNLRLHPVTGAVAAIDGVLNPGTPAIGGAAYTNSFPGATTTVLFDIDHASDKLMAQMPPNDGVLVEVGSLGLDVEAGNGFDIGGTSNMAYGIFTSAGATKIYSVNTSTGAAMAISDFPNQVVGFAIGVGF